MPVQEQPQSEFRTPEQEREDQEAAIKAAAESTDPPNELGGSTDKTKQTAMDATAWFLSRDVLPTPTDSFELNVGTKNKPVWVRFEIEGVDRDMLKQIQVDSIDKDTGREDEVKSNELLAIQALTNPDLSQEEVRGGLADPRDALRRMLGHKPMLIDHIASRAMKLSGSSGDDIREAAVSEVNAAGN